MRAEAERAGAEVLVVDDAGPSEPARAAGRAPRRPLRGRIEGTRPERRAQHRRRARHRRAGRVPRRRRPAFARLARSAAARRAPSTPTVEVFAGPDHGDAGRTGAAQLRARAAADHDARPRRPGPSGALRVGRQHGDPPQRRFERVGPVRRDARRGRRRAGVAGTLRGDDPARVLYAAAPRSSTAAPGDDARLRALCARVLRARARRAALRRAPRPPAPRAARELATLGGCVGHVLRRRCPAGLTMVAHSAGGCARRCSARRPRPSRSRRRRRRATGLPLGRERHGRRARRAAARGRDELAAAGELLSGRSLRLAPRGARARRRGGGVLALSVERPERARLAGAIAGRARALAPRGRAAHERQAGAGGKFENLNRLLAAHPAARPRLAARDRRRRRAAARLPRPLRVPLRALRADARAARAPPALARRVGGHAPPPRQRRARDELRRDRAGDRLRRGELRRCCCRSRELRMGWGLDMHWAALAREQGWRCGVLDAVAIRHRAGARRRRLPARAGRSPRRASFLATRPHITARRGATDAGDAPALVSAGPTAPCASRSSPSSTRASATRCSASGRTARRSRRGTPAPRSACSCCTGWCRRARRSPTGPRRPPRALRAPRAEPRRQVRDGLTVEYVPYVSPPRERAYPRWGAWAAPRAGARAAAAAPRRFPYELSTRTTPCRRATRCGATHAAACRSSSRSTAATCSTRPARGAPARAAVARGLGAARLVLANSQGIAELARATARARRASCTSAPTCRRRRAARAAGGDAERSSRSRT